MEIDEELEQLIDIAGREEVFRLVRSNGWGSDVAIPKFIWKIAAVQVLAKKDLTNQKR